MGVTEERMRQIKDMLEKNMTRADIARALNLSKGYISNLTKRIETVKIDNTPMVFHNNMVPELNEWLRRHYIPHMTLIRNDNLHATKFHLFNCPPLHYPKKFIEPQCRMDDVEACAVIFTTEWLSKSDATAQIEKLLYQANQRGGVDNLFNLESDIGILIDQTLIRQFKSQIRCADALYQYICSM